MNQYLRGLVEYNYKNLLLEHVIQSMWMLINDAPSFDKSYILYRFIKNDDHLKHLKIGDKFIFQSFISTTRDPFYRPNKYKFGFILIKIKIPGNIKGVALCIEPLSHFKKEQEIILSPLSILQLDKKDANAPYYHTDKTEQVKIRIRYEFTYIEKKEINFIDRPVYNNKQVDFLNIDKIKALTINERIIHFVSNYVNPYYQFRAKIGDNIHDIIVEWYDSTEVYKDFYAAITNNGFSMYTIINDYITFFIELGEDSYGTFMFVNYYFRHSTISKNIGITDKNLVDFLASVAYYFEIKNIKIYADYTSCDLKDEIYNIKNSNLLNENKYFGGNYCVDFYNYLKNNSKRYSKFDSKELKPGYSYYQLDRLKKMKPSEILPDRDRDEVYQLYHKTYKDVMPKEKDNVADFYVWVVDYHCSVFLKILVEKMIKYYVRNNPFDNDHYILDAVLYLYNKKMITDYPVFSGSSTDTDKINKQYNSKNIYRLSRKRSRNRLLQ
jgi:hypothetical protein